MGQFSWLTQNSNTSIFIYDYIPDTIKQYGGPTYYMWDNKGNYWVEKKYEGYGMFGGKDYYVLLAEMNNTYGAEVDDEKKRLAGIDIDCSNLTTYVGKDGNVHEYLFPNLTSCRAWIWYNKKPTSCYDQGVFTEDCDF